MELTTAQCDRACGALLGNVKRSAFVCALLVPFPDVVVRSTRPTVLELLSRDR
jgi:hypothetical protein